MVYGVRSRLEDRCHLIDAMDRGVYILSFHPERVLFRPGGVNLRDCLCDIPEYDSAQSLDFLARTQNPLFPIWKLHSVRMEFPDEHYLGSNYGWYPSPPYEIPFSQG